MSARPRPSRTLFLTGLALVGFASNSLLCRAALGRQAIDAWSFTAVRLAAGALVLAPLARWSREPAATPAAERASLAPRASAGSWLSAAALAAYAICFSLAYLRLGTGVGALTLFGAVQVTMVGSAVLAGERPSVGEWAGILLAFGGLVVLSWRALATPDAWGFTGMLVAGVAWAVYSLRGRTARAPLAANAGNFARALAPALLGLVVCRTGLHAAPRGLVLAGASGALASGVGYSLWYAALPDLGATRAAVVQLLVPMLAALAGMLWLGEHPSARFLIAAAMILGGVGLALAQRVRARARR